MKQLLQSRNFLGLASEQCLYNLVERSSELEVLPACEAYGMGVIPWSPLNRGLLGGVLQKIEGGRRADEETQRYLAEHRDRSRPVPGRKHRQNRRARDEADVAFRRTAAEQNRDVKIAAELPTSAYRCDAGRDAAQSLCRSGLLGARARPLFRHCLVHPDYEATALGEPGLDRKDCHWGCAALVLLRARL